MIDEKSFVRTLETMLDHRVQLYRYKLENFGAKGLYAEHAYYESKQRDSLSLRAIYYMVLAEGVSQGQRLLLEQQAEERERASKRKKRSPPKKKRRTSRT